MIKVRCLSFSLTQFFSSPKGQMKNGDKVDCVYADPNNYKLAKRLAYILRYGAVKEGLGVTEKGKKEWTNMLVKGTSITVSECLWELFEGHQRQDQGNRGHGIYEIPGLD